MADSTIKPVLSVCATVGSRLADLPLKDGQLIFVKDKQKIALDFGGKRTVYECIIELATDGARKSMLAPVTGSYYFVLETTVLWTYRDGSWIQITTPPSANLYFTNLALAKAAAASAKQIGSSDATYFYGMKLLVDDGVFAKWYTIQRDGSLLEEGVEIRQFDNTLVYENGVLRVNTTNETAADNTLPITSAGVYTQLGNIGALLEII